MAGAVVFTVMLSYLVLLPNASNPAVEPQAQAVLLSAPETAEAFLDAVHLGDFTRAAALTDDPAGAAKVLGESTAGMAARGVAFVLDATAPAPDAVEAQQRWTTTWALGSGQSWSYPNAMALVRNGGTWVIRWSPAIVHPQLAPGLRLGYRQTQPGSVAVQDSAGRPMFAWSGTALVPVSEVPLDSAITTAIEAGARPVSAGTGQVVLVDAGGADVASLFGTPPQHPGPATASIDLDVQRAANAAVAGAQKPTLLVAIRPSTGGILAAVGGGSATAQTAFNGLYPPGSTFKVVTANAVLGAGRATPGSTVPCPGVVTVGTRTIRNAGFQLGEVPLRTAFAQSCNTTFAALAGDLPPSALTRSAGEFGLAADFDVPGLRTQTGRVTSADSPEEQAENSIGQGTVQVSPFGLALMSATVARGSAVTPFVVDGVPTEVDQGYQGPSAANVQALRSMMREVVTSGRATALTRYGASGKTGTAQYGDGSTAHGWFTGYRKDVAFAVLVEGAGSATPAVDVSGRFLAGLG
ncbi:penicillin-binding transpeptidase domain-containing protein [Actinokineospora bangkokensis]|nr:penicillin-binding transpeptidase domain-containing protein [Actinokineospora bangkokensis]